ncbi:MAG: prolyl oligopeptidase family serine peptidase [Candidatus Brocadiia bacterium]
MALLAAGPWALAQGAERGPELLCAPSPSGAVTTWLVAGPMKFLRAEDFAQDFLAGTGGEAGARPRGGEVAHPGEGVAWRPQVFPSAAVNLREQCLPLGHSAFYLAAVLVPRRDFEATLYFSHTGHAQAWVDGEELFRSKPDPYALEPPVVRRKLSLEKGRRAHLLVKVGSEGRRLQFLAQMLTGRAGVSRRDLAIALPVADEAAAAPEAYVLSALRLGLGDQETVTPGKAATVVFEVGGGYPLCEGAVGATIAVRDSQGRTTAELEVPPLPLPARAAKPARLAWTPAEDHGSPYYELVAQVTYQGRELGALAHTVYSRRDLAKWTMRLDQRAGELAAKGTVAPDALALVRLKLEKAAQRQFAAESLGLYADEVQRELREASRLLARLEKGKGLPPLEPGVHELAYIAPQDDSPQPYYLHIPRVYEGTKALPAIVYLHGYAPWLDKTNWHQLSYGLTDLAEAHGYIIICPFARSNTDFQGIGEVDVLHVLRLARERVKVDPRRTFLLGYSMGGMGTYTVAAHRPHLWAGVVALCGRADYYFWKGLERARVEPFKRHLLDAEFGWPLAPNFLHVPVLAYQGTADVLIKPRQAYRFVERLKKLGTDATVVRLEGQSHWIADQVFSTPQAFEWMDRRRRPEAPATVRFRTYALQHNRAYWLTIDAFARWAEPAEVEATLQAGNRIELRAENVARLTLRPPPGRCDLDAPFAVALDGAERTVEPDAEGRLRVRLAPFPDEGLRKTPRLCGPIKDVFNRRFLLVYGTTGGEEASKANRQAATRMQREWYAFAKGIRRVTADTALGDEEIEGSNLILFGTPRTHALLARIAPRLPIRITEQAYQVGEHTYKASPGTGLMFIYPNPLAPERYVVVCCGLPYGEHLPPNHKYDLLPDYIVYSDQADYDDTNAYYCAGFFDVAWRLDPELTWTSNGKPQPAPAAAQEPAEEPLGPRQPAPAAP